MEADDTADDGLPIYEAERFETPMEISHALATGRLPLPCWIRIGRTSMKVADEDALALTRGILMAELLRAYHRDA